MSEKHEESLHGCLAEVFFGIPYMVAGAIALWVMCWSMWTHGAGAPYVEMQMEKMTEQEREEFKEFRNERGGFFRILFGDKQ